MILNRVKDYSQNDEERLQARDKYRNLSEEDKNKKREYGRNRYHKRKEKKTKRISKSIVRLISPNSICYDLVIH